MRLGRILLGTGAFVLASAVAGAGPAWRDLRDIPSDGGASDYYRDADRDGTLNVYDCNDDDAYAHPGATEAWNGIDDDCNGTIDDGFDTTVDRATKKVDRILWPDGKAALPSEWVSLDAAPRIAWTGAIFVAVWTDRGDNLRLARLTHDGVPLDPVPLTLRSGARAPDIAWTGTRLAIVYEDRSGGRSDVRLMTVNRYVEPLLDVLVHVDAYEPRVAWGHQQLGIVWRRATCAGDCIGYRTVDPDGRPLEPIEMLANSGRGAAIAWSGSGTVSNTIAWNVEPGRFGIVYEAYYAFAASADLLLVTRDPAGALPGEQVRVNTHDGAPAPGGPMPAIAGSPSGFAVSWHFLANDVEGARLRFFSLRGLEGAREYPPDADTAFGSDVTWTGSEFVVVNENAAVGPAAGTDVHFRPVDATCNPHSSGNWGPWAELNVSAGAGGAVSTKPAIANAGPIFGVVWVEQEGAEGYGRIRFASLAHR